MLSKQSDGRIYGGYVIEASAPGEDDPHAIALTQALKKNTKFYVRDNRYIVPGDENFYFSKDGLEIDTLHSPLEATRQSLGQPRKPELIIKIAEDMFRLLILMSSRNVEVKYFQSKESNIDDTSTLPRRSPHSFKLEIATTPIVVDLKTSLARAIRTRHGADIKRLLGWTDVIRHRRTYHTLQGPVEKTIEPHDRRIATPVDRRFAARQITSSEPNLELDLSNERPRIAKHRKWPRLKR